MATRKTQKSKKEKVTLKTSPKYGTSLDRKVKRRRPELVVKAIVDPKTRAKLARKHQKRQPLTWREYTVLGLVATCAVAIVCSFAVKASFNPERDAEEALARLTDAYYMEYLYPRIVGNKSNGAEELAQYKETGLPLVYLRQFFTFNDKTHADEREYFVNDYYKCDENTSRVRFMPVEPYGNRDFTYTMTLNCERVEK